MCLIFKKGTCPALAVYTSNYPSTSHVNMVVLMRYPSGILFFLLLPPFPIWALEIGVAVKLIAEASCMLGLKSSCLYSQRLV